jgi:anti-sigma B factor antagonist
MQTTTEQSGDARVLHLAGRLIANRHEECVSDLVHQLVEGGARLIVLDLEGISYMDSTCLGELIEARRHAVERGGELTLVNVSARIRRLLRLSGLDDIFLAPPAVNGHSVHSAA